MAQRNSTNTQILGITAHFRRQDGKSVDPPLPEFDRSGYVYTGEAYSVNLYHCRDVLKGNLDALFNAFTWCATVESDAFDNGSYWYGRRLHRLVT
jgi:hypothetical protein